MNFPKFLSLFIVMVNCEFDSNVIDVDDILSEDYMPGTLLVLENPSEGVNNFNGTIKKFETLRKVPDGSFGNAMETMNFHRSMINQYLCRNFVAEQIVKDMTTSRVNRRMGHVTPGVENVKEKPSKFKPALQNTLLNDEGSSNYKNWLSKSATLEDLYRHYDQADNRVDVEVIEEEEKGEDFDEEYNGHEGQPPAKHRGHTGLGMYYAGGGGYPYPNPVYHHGGGGGTGGGYHYGGGSGGGYYHGGDSGYQHSGGGSGGGGYSHDSGYGDGGYSNHDGDGGGHHTVVETIYHGGPPKYQGQHDVSYGGKDHDLSDLFDIALTALAFLSFGLFIVHVIMCISAATSTTTTTVASMMPMSMSPTATATGGTGNGGGSMTSTGGGGTGGGSTSTGGDGGMTATGGGSTSTGGGSTSIGGDGGMTATGGGSTGTGGDGGMTATGGGSTGTDAGSTGTGGDGGMTATGGGSTSTGTGAGSTGTGGDSTGTGEGGEATGGGESTGGGSTGTGGGDIDSGGNNTGSGSPGTGTGTGGGTTGDEMTATGTGDGNTGTGSGRDTFKFRLRRDMPTITNPNNEALNELARRVLTSIEAALVAQNDNGVCLWKSLCENNKYSRSLEGKSKIIIPVWSLGMSWLAGRLVKGAPKSTSMLDTLKASILGLGRANCEIIYQDCDLNKERRKRKRRRRKRNVVPK